MRWTRHSALVRVCATLGVRGCACLLRARLLPVVRLAGAVVFSARLPRAESGCMRDRLACDGAGTYLSRSGDGTAGALDARIGSYPSTSYSSASAAFSHP
ncbi:hypothetical protein C8J57DRAFT_1344780 [Mycena rebaudengoi]|nr:hypothetical protein C8J57DRAFT_1344780 [Mycena rebaudengoi]